MDYKEPALLGFIQAAIDYINYSKANGEKVDLGGLSSTDINFLRDTLGLNFDNDAAAILRGHQAFRDIVYKRQNDRDAFSRGEYFPGEPKEKEQVPVEKMQAPERKEQAQEISPFDLFKTSIDEVRENQASSKESAEEIDSLLSQIDSATNTPEVIFGKETTVSDKENNNAIEIAKNEERTNAVKESINRIKNIAGKDLRIANNEEVDPVFEYVEKEDDYYRLVKNISRAFSKLPIDFIKDVLSYREEIDRDYAVNESFIVLHRVSFKDVDDLRKFAEIMMSHQYFTNVDEQKGIVDVFKQIVNTSGKIITLICEVANQATFVNGTYEGYKVIKAE